MNFKKNQKYGSLCKNDSIENSNPRSPPDSRDKMVEIEIYNNENSNQLSRQASTNTMNSNQNEDVDPDDYLYNGQTNQLNNQDSLLSPTNKNSFDSNQILFNSEDLDYNQHFEETKQEETQSQQNQYQQYESNFTIQSQHIQNEQILSVSDQRSLDSQQDYSSLAQNQGDSETKEIDDNDHQPNSKGKKKGRPYNDIDIEFKNIEQLRDKKTHCIINVRCIARYFRQHISIEKDFLKEEFARKIRDHFKDDSPAEIIQAIEDDLKHCRIPAVENKTFNRPFKKDRVIVTNDNISLLGRLCYRHNTAAEIKLFKDPKYKFLFEESMSAIKEEFKDQEDVLITLKSILKAHEF